MLSGTFKGCSRHSSLHRLLPESSATLKLLTQPSGRLDTPTPNCANLRLQFRHGCGMARRMTLYCAARSFRERRSFKASYRPLLLPLSRCWGHDSWIAILLGAVGTLVFVDEKLMSHRQHGGNLIGAIQAKPKRLERWAKKLCEPRQHYRRALATVTYFSKQMDDLHRRLACWPESACSQKFREAIGRRRMKLQRRKRVVELILSVLDNFHLQHDSTTEELPPPR